MFLDDNMLFVATRSETIRWLIGQQRKVLIHRKQSKPSVWSIPRRTFHTQIDSSPNFLCISSIRNSGNLMIGTKANLNLTRNTPSVRCSSSPTVLTSNSMDNVSPNFPPRKRIYIQQGQKRAPVNTDLKKRPKKSYALKRHRPPVTWYRGIPQYSLGRSFH